MSVHTSHGQTGSGAAGSAPTGVRCEGIVKWFGGVRALNGVSLAVSPGEIVALCGDNGAGKSTLVKILSGLHQPDGGEIWIGGQRVRGLTPSTARAHGVETVYQDLALCDNLDAVSNVVLGQEPVRFKLGPISFLNKREAARMARQRLSDVGIRISDVNASVHRMSGGQRQAIAIARGMMFARSLMLLDEPTAALGVRETKGTLDVIKAVAAQGIGVLVISHSMEDVFTIADRVVVLRLGRVAFDGVKAGTTPEQIVGHITGGAMGVTQ